MALVLIVDDCVDSLILLKDFILKLGHTCRLASSGQQALDVIGTDLISLIISDYQMINGDGLWLLDELRQLVFAPPCIILTADRTYNKEHFVNLGASALCLKPIKWEELQMHIEKILPTLM